MTRFPAPACAPVLCRSDILDTRGQIYIYLIVGSLTGPLLICGQHFENYKGRVGGGRVEGQIKGCPGHHDTLGGSSLSVFSCYYFKCK